MPPARAASSSWIYGRSGRWNKRQARRNLRDPLRRPKESPAAAASHRTCCSRAGCSTSFFSISVTAHAHFVVLMGFGVLPIVPIVQAKTALPWFGHAQIVLPAQALREGCGGSLPAPAAQTSGGDQRPDVVGSQFSFAVTRVGPMQPAMDTFNLGAVTG